MYMPFIDAELLIKTAIAEIRTEEFERGYDEGWQTALKILEEIIESKSIDNGRIKSDPLITTGCYEFYKQYIETH